MNKAMEIEKLATATANDPRWLSVVERKKTADGTFYYSVRTTGATAARRARHVLRGPRMSSFIQPLRMPRRSAFVPANGVAERPLTHAGERNQDREGVPPH
jgi:Metal binding domain of Ada